MKFIKSLRPAIACAILLSTGAANASLLQFDVSGPHTVSFQLDSTPTLSYSDPYQFNVSGRVDVSYDHGPAEPVALQFFAKQGAGGFYSGGQNFGFNSGGPQLFGGTTSAPIFATGSYALEASFQNGNQTPGYTLTISDANAVSVPEPASVALLIGGLALLVAARKRPQA